MCRVSEGVFRDEYCEADDGTASEVDDVVDCDHFQVQDDRPGSSDWPSQDQCSADVAGLPHVKLTALVARFDLEDVESPGVARGGLHLKNISRDAAPRGQVHVAVQNSERPFSTGGVLCRTQTLIVTELYVWRFTYEGVQTCVPSLEIETHLCCCTRVVTRLTFIEVFAAPAILKDVVTGRTRARERARSVYTRVLTQEV